MLARALAQLGAPGCTTPKHPVLTVADYALVKVITPDGLQPPPYPWEQVRSVLDALETELAFNELRKERNARLAASDFVVLTDVNVPDKEAWLAYRSALRDLPSTAQPGLTPGTETLDPTSVVWPTEPAR